MEMDIEVYVSEKVKMWFKFSIEINLIIRGKVNYSF